jgi:sporulation protein YlmC with PRC-barrel domain
MRFSESLGRKIVSLATAETIGTLGEFVVDPQSQRVVALGVSKYKNGDTLPWNSIESFGPDAVTVSDETRIAAADPGIAQLSGKDHAFLGKRVLATSGDELGQVDDVDFDPDSGVLLTIALPGAEISAERLVGVGSYAVVVEAEPTAA